jgi:hypothetical protein
MLRTHSGSSFNPRPDNIAPSQHPHLVTGINGHIRVRFMEYHKQPENRPRINQLQRQRRRRFTRIDYIDVSPEAREVIDSLLNGGINGTVSAILNRIVVEWSKKNGCA